MSFRSSSFTETDFQAIKLWAPEHRKNVCLTIWVNSQNIQVALCPVGDAKKAIYMSPIPVTKAGDVQQHFDQLRGSFAKESCSVIFATMSFAGPVSQDHVVVTNWQCEARERVIQFTQLPFDLFPLDRRRFMNDLEAASYGIIAKSLGNQLQSIFCPVWQAPDVPITLDGSSLVLSIGSGFGTSFICREDSCDHNCVVSSEAGHGQAITCSESDANYQDEVDFIRFVSQKLHGGSHQPEWEDLCACRGLELAYQFLKSVRRKVELDSTPSYDQIRTLALGGGDSDALTAFKMHYRFVIRSAQTLTLGIQCQRVFLISNRQVKNREVMEIIGEDLRTTFEDHPRPDWFKNIIVYMQKMASNFSLSGGLFLSRVLAVAHQRQAHVSTS
jgi:glucokinase